ncbi:hypothetical protein WR25_15067 isoform C [Diploscapter pachys]|uniref:Uncharacterized protein n=2 Tax=Diploscapter pachys TaxID=2018661 RepID=A0A2A2M319_9BILA|nr:hypothetical protein WR25_15067 isoform C [Diploscapter pachys]
MICLGKNSLPSIVSFGEEEILVGNPALNYHDLSSILYDSKRLIGWKFMYNLPIAENRLLWSFNLDSRNGTVGYILKSNEGTERFVTPEEVSSMILRKVKTIAETYLGANVTGAVVAVPAFFQENQIASTKEAIKMAGLELKCLIEEPTAAAIAYNAERQLENSRIMIFDFGGGQKLLPRVHFHCAYRSRIKLNLKYII